MAFVDVEKHWLVTVYSIVIEVSIWHKNNKDIFRKVIIQIASTNVKDGPGNQFQGANIAP